ncbi:Amino Acid/Auxin Permease (AAAP) Family [Thraustotheca clavata]|uniref:Amino Acid/Auxin Permease (AAAP) Family n=1 Tax=Thraustotheca clavata TaxID=74557 RepID=A0A1V9Y7P3_9STRA|nr:Amino Acid/Auxin Permease (AAAP) Family [Thraustotheca clavata]
MTEARPLLGKLQHGEDIEQHATIGTSYLGLMSTMAGACILALPSTMGASHVIPNTILLIIVTVLSLLACSCLVIACDATGVYSYELLSKRLCSPWQIWAIRALTMGLLFGAVVMYIVISMDMLEPFVPLSRFVLGALFTIISLPMCLPDTIHALRYTNFLVVLCVMYIVAILSWHAFQNPWPNVSLTSPITYSAIAYTMPIQALSYCCHLNVARAYGELEHRSNITIVSSLIMVSGGILYFIASLAGYVCFQGMPPADILTGFSSDDTSVNGVRIALGLCMICKTPVTFQPFREVIELVCLGPATHEEQRHRMPFRVFATSIFLLASFILAVSAQDISVVMGLIGGTSGVLLSFTVPGYFVWQVTQAQDHGLLPDELKKYRILAVVMMATGFLFTIVSLTK